MTVAELIEILESLPQDAEVEHVADGPQYPVVSAKFWEPTGTVVLA